MKEPLTKNVLDEINKSKTLKEGLDYIEKNIEILPDKSFPDFFNDYLAKHQEKKLSDIIERSCLSRTYAYEIINGKKKGGRDKIIALCYAAGMTVDEVSHALTYSGNNPIYPKINRDAIIQLAFTLMNKHNPNNGSAMTLNNLLAEKGYAELDI